MPDNNNYKVVLSGQFLDGFDPEQVKQDFAKLFKQDVQALARYFQGNESVIKKDIDEPKARAYQGALQKIGMQARVEPLQVSPLESLSLVPIDDDQSQQVADNETADGAAALAPGMMACPRCGQEQAEAAQCSHCGVYVDKVRQQQAGIVVEQEVEGEDTVAASEIPATMEHLDPKVIGAAAAAAVLGALLWQLIAVMFGYELGIVAWAIGGGVGYAAAFVGGRGQITGMTCGALALVAILGGKYLAVESWKGELADSMNSEEIWGEVEGQLIFEEINEDARLYQALGGDEQALRNFLFERGYSEADNPASVSPQELESFYLYDEPQLIWVLETKPDYDTWKTYAVASFSDLSSMDLVQSSFGLIDLVFIFLGVGTAYRLGFTGRQSPAA